MNKAITLILFITSLIISSCKEHTNLDGMDGVEYWKLPTLHKYSYDKYNTYIDNYLDSRFDEVGGLYDNEIHNGYLDIAKVYVKKYLQNHHKDYNLELNMNSFREEIVNSDYSQSCLSAENKANLESNPQVWFDNVKKVIGDINDLCNELRSHVSVAEKELFYKGGYKGYNVLYNIDDDMYVISTIVLKGNGGSEIKWLANDKSLINILQIWQDEEAY